VNYAMLRNYIGKVVSVIGKVLHISPSGNQLQLRMSDGNDVVVTLKDSLEELLQGYIQVTASVEKDGTLTAEHIISFGDREIDLKMYNEAVELASKYSELFTFSEGNSLTY